MKDREKLIKEPKFKIGDTVRYKYNNICTKPRTIAKISGLSHYVDMDGYRMEMAYTDANFELVEKSVNKVDVDAAMADVEAKAKTFTESHKSESSDEILAQMRGEEPVSKQKLSNVKRIVKNWKEPVKDLEEVAVDYGNRSAFTDVDPFNWILEIAFKDGACWQKQQMMKDATEVTVHVDAGGYPYIPQIELYDYDKDIPLAKEGDKYKVVLIKEE